MLIVVMNINDGLEVKNSRKFVTECCTEADVQCALDVRQLALPLIQTNVC